MAELIGLTSAGALPPKAVELIQDMLAGSNGFLRSGNNVTFTYSDDGQTLTISATGGGGTTIDAEAVRDTIAAALRVNGGLTLTTNDAGDTITLGTQLTVANMPAGYRHTLVKVNGVWPDRGTARTDIVVEFIGPNPHPNLVSAPATNGMYENDLRTVTDA